MASLVLHLVGSPTSQFWSDLSLVYARGAYGALSQRYAFQNVYIAQDGSWRFPSDLSDRAIETATPIPLNTALKRIQSLQPMACMPQMFCPEGMTRYRNLIEALDIPLIGNGGSVMQICADKVATRIAVSEQGIPVPDAVTVERGSRIRELPFALPAVVKPVIADNSDGVTLVRNVDDIRPALDAAFQISEQALIERFIPPGREVRCGVVEIDGRAVPTPLEEYDIGDTRPIRLPDDKLGSDPNGGIALMAKNDAAAWIVPEEDPAIEPVQQLAVRAHQALDCRHYSLFDFRIDPNGNAFFLEAGPYCSFAPDSVLVTMMRAAGTSLETFFAHCLAQATAPHPLIDKGIDHGHTART